jgi:outer membrane receptor protein involved in Fe transport
MFVDSNVYTESGGSLTQFGSLTTIPVTNPFIPADLQTLLAARPNATAPFTWNGRYMGIPYKGWDESYLTSQYLAGVAGDLPFGNWTYDVFGSYDTTDHNQTMYFATLKSRVQTLLNAADGGASICAGGFNPFGIVNTSALSEECRNYMTTTAHSQERLSQTVVQGSIQGSLFELPAGDVKIAFLADQRRNDYEYTPDTELAAQNIEAVIASAGATGEIDVTEFATQFEIPLLADAPFAQSLTLGAAYRFSDYSTAGGVDAYEGDLKWRPVDSFLIRTSYQRAVRAPSIGELFSAAQGVQVAFGNPPGALGDPCDIRSSARTGPGGASVRQLCLDQGIPAPVIDAYVFPTTATAGVQSGNPDLDPETADTYNLGFQWSSGSESALWSGLSMSVDYYNIEIDDVISVVPGLTTLSKCYNLDGSNPNYAVSDPFCQLLERDDNGLLSLIRTPYFNLGSLATDGVDLQFNWTPELSAFGLNSSASLFLNSYINYTTSYEIQTVPGGATQDYVNTISVGNSHPEWKAMTTLGYAGDALTVGLRWRFLGAMDDVTAVTTPATPLPGTPSYSTYDLFGNYNINDRLQIRAGVTNFTDELSVRVSSSQNSTDTSVYNPIGRSWYLGMNFSM